MNLNGFWEFEIDPGRSGRERGIPQSTRPLDGRIIVPFAPESSCSGVNHTDFMPAVWYRRRVVPPSHWSGHRLLLHVGACDYAATVYVDGVEVGCHVGGYTPFTIDVTEHMRPGVEAAITIGAEDDVRSFAQARGKQSRLYHSNGCDYTRTTGIWQTVWLEAVPPTYLASARITPHLAAGGVTVEIRVSGDALPPASRLYVCARADGSVVGEAALAAARCVSLYVPLTHTRAWSPDDPFLYDLDLRLESASGNCLDEVTSYVGLRSITIDGPVVQLNGRPLFQRLVLDQGFYPDGLYTAPDDRALQRDIELAKALGFNGARLHQKVFEPRFLYWADRLGYLVWAEGPDWGLEVDRADGLAGYMQTVVEMLERDVSHPSIVGWCMLNEHDVSRNREACRALYRMARAYDGTRPVIDASGWQHVESDIFDVHDYDQDPETFAARYRPLENGDGPVHANTEASADTARYRRGQPYFVSEFGGIWWNPGEDDPGAWGYGSRPHTEDAFLSRFEGLCGALLANPAIFGFCYTQLTDVEQEVNGLYTYDRRPKFDPARIRACLESPAAIEAPSRSPGAAA